MVLNTGTDYKGMFYGQNPQDIDSNVEAIRRMYGEQSPQYSEILKMKGDVESSISGQKQSMADMIRQSIAQGTQDIKSQYAPLYEQLVSDQAATGRLRSPVSLLSTGRLRQQQGTDITNLIRGLYGKQAELQYGAEASRPSSLMNLYQLGQSERNAETQRTSDMIGKILGRASQVESTVGAREGRNLQQMMSDAQQRFNYENAAAEGKRDLENRMSFGEGLAGSAVSGLAGGIGGMGTAWAGESAKKGYIGTKPGKDKP